MKSKNKITNESKLIYRTYNGYQRAVVRMGKIGEGH